MVQKGLISELSAGGKTARVTPYNGGAVTALLVVQDSIAGTLEINMPVLYVTFPDGTGTVILRMDGVQNLTQGGETR